MPRDRERWFEDETEIAELLWCAAHLRNIISLPLDQQEGSEGTSAQGAEGDTENRGESREAVSVEEVESEARIPIAAKVNREGEIKSPPSAEDGKSESKASTVSITDPFCLPKPVQIGKALLPLSKRVSSRLKDELDVDATVEVTAEANGLITPIYRSSQERWFEIHLLVDYSPTMEFWGDLADDFATLFRWQGFFRDVRVWRFETGGDEPRLLSGSQSIERDIASLIEPCGHRLFLVLTDTLGKAWHSGKAFAALSVLGERHPLAIAHIYPQPLWERTALEGAIQRPLIAHQPESPNSKLTIGATRLRTKAPLYQFPILNVSDKHLSTWAKFVAGEGGNSIQGVLIKQEIQLKEPAARIGEQEESADEMLRGFDANASPEARELARILASVPLLPPIIRLAQRQFLSESEHWHLAEVFFSGLIKRHDSSPSGARVLDAWYDFEPGIRQLLLEDSPVKRSTEIWQKIGDYIERHYGSPRDFLALVPNPTGSVQGINIDLEYYFAEVKAAILMTWGGEYADEARRLKDNTGEKISSSEISQPILEQAHTSSILLSARGIDYSELAELLKQQKWKRADDLTYTVMLEVANRSSEEWLRDEDIDNFPCEDLRTIDRLWVDNSKGRFGFSVQAKIYRELGGTREYNEKVWKAFGDRMGWRVSGDWIYYKDVTFDLKAPQGHLPTGAGSWGGGSSCAGLFSRVETCEV
jgi:hypothetical protein